MPNTLSAYQEKVQPSGKAPVHRRRMEEEDKSKVVASVWGAECVQFLAAVDLKEKDEFYRFFQIDLPFSMLQLLSRAVGRII